MTVKTLYFIRHGETESNRNGVFRGRLDIPLSERGRVQAGELRCNFQDISIDALYTSPLQRAVETARLAFPGIEPLPLESLNNLDLGQWAGKEKELIRRQFPAKWKRWTCDPESICFPQGESLADVYCRAIDFLATVVSSDAQTSAAISHRSVAKVLMAVAVGLKENYYWRFHLDNASVSQLIFESGRGWTIVKMNQTHHLTESIMEWY